MTLSLLKIGDNEYRPSGTIRLYGWNEKSVVVDGETYTNKQYYEEEFDIDKSFNEKPKLKTVNIGLHVPSYVKLAGDWSVIEYKEFEFLNGNTYNFWNNNYNSLYKSFRFNYDFSKNDSINLTYNLYRSGYLAPEITCMFTCQWGDNRHAKDALLKSNEVCIHIDSYNGRELFFCIKYKDFIKSNIHEMGDYQKERFMEQYSDFFPQEIIERKLTIRELTKLSLKIFQKQIETKLTTR